MAQHFQLFGKQQKLPSRWNLIWYCIPVWLPYLAHAQHSHCCSIKVRAMLHTDNRFTHRRYGFFEWPTRLREEHVPRQKPDRFHHPYHLHHFQPLLLNDPKVLPDVALDVHH